MLSQKEKCIWDKLSEAAKATILGNAKAPHKPYTRVKFHGVTLGELIKASSHQFYFFDTRNGPSNNDIVDKEYRTDNDGDTYMILTNLSKRENISPVDIIKVLSNPNPYFIQEIKELTIGGKLYCQVNPKFIYVSNHNHKRC